MIARVSMATLALACLVIAGCSIVNDPAQHTGSPPDGGVDAPAPEELDPGQICPRLMRLQCREYADCCETAPSGFDVDACVDGLLADCTDTIGRYVADSRTAYDGALAAEAFAIAESLLPSCSVDLARWHATREGLTRMFAGAIGPGEVCTPRDDMDYAAFFSCMGEDRTCGPAATGFSCMVRVRAGMPCYLNSDCVEGLACNGVAGTVPGTCGDRAPAASPCTADGDCQSYVCRQPAGQPLGVCAPSTQRAIFCPGG